jgi:hypothetical protein
MPDRDSRRYYIPPSGHPIPVERCEDWIWLDAPRVAATAWFDQFRFFDGDWRLTWIAESPRHGYLHTAVSRMIGTPNTGTFRHNLRRAHETVALYGLKPIFEVAICHRDPAFEGGPSHLLEEIRRYSSGLISLPPSLARLREIEVLRPRVDMVLLPPSPQMSNKLRLQLATPALVRRSSLRPLKPWVS